MATIEQRIAALEAKFELAKDEKGDPGDRGDVGHRHDARDGGVDQRNGDILELAPDDPEVLLTATPKVPGLDGRKMSKSYGNTIGLREDTDSVVKKLKAMQTDPARVRRRLRVRAHHGG